MQRVIAPIFPAGWIITDDPGRTRAASELKKFCFSDRGQWAEIPSCRFCLDIRRGLLLERPNKKTYMPFCEVTHFLALGSSTVLYQGRVPGTQQCTGWQMSIKMISSSEAQRLHGWGGKSSFPSKALFVHLEPDSFCPISNSPERRCLSAAQRFADKGVHRGTKTLWRLRHR